VAEQAAGWNERGNVGLVAGATYPNEVCSVRALAPNEWLLMPGIGQQGGDLEAALKNGLRADSSGVIVNASRSIIYAEDPREAAMNLRAQIQAIRAEHRGGDGGCETEARPTSVAPNLIDLAIGLYEVGAIQFGDFTLQSGQPSPFYIDLRLIIGDSDVLAHAARAYVEILNNANVYYNRIAAIPYAALPISTAISLQAKVPLLWPRKERKAYGTMRAIEGPFEPGETVVVVDDLITTGASKLEALKPLREAGLRVKDIAVLIDREGGGREEMEAQGINVHSVFRLRELMEILYEHERITPEQKVAVERFVAGQAEPVA
jgi:uridine monophosphate synthetase